MITGWTDGFIRAFAITKHAYSPQLWEMANAHNGPISTVFVDQNYIISGGEDGLVRIWSRKIRKLCYQIACHTKKITAAFPDILQSHIIHSCSMDKTVHTYDLKKNKKVIYHTQNNGKCSVLTSRPDSRYVAEG